MGAKRIGVNLRLTAAGRYQEPLTAARVRLWRRFFRFHTDETAVESFSARGIPVGEAVYRVVREGDQWRLEHEEQRVLYLTKEGAFQAAAFAAQRAIHESILVQILIDPEPNVLMGRRQT